MTTNPNDDDASIKDVNVYTRVSTEDQAKEGFSLDAQLERLRYYARARGWNIVGEYTDEGYSGRDTKRRGYQQLMENLDKCDAILVVKMDRIHRNQLNFTSMMSNLKKGRKAFVSIVESLDTSTAMGRFCMDLMARLHQLESEVTGERILEIQSFIYNTTAKWHGPPPYGFMIVDGHLQIDETEARWVKWMARLAVGGTSSIAIEAALNRLAVPTRSGGDHLWDSHQVRDLLYNPAIAGLRVWQKHAVATHSAILTMAEFEELHEALTRRGRKYRPERTDTRRGRRYAKLRRHLDNGEFKLRKAPDADA